jgi:hypothetical protein
LQRDRDDLKLALFHLCGEGRHADLRS